MLQSPTRKDVDRLRELGKRLAEIAALPEQREHRKIWTAVNDCAMIRPAVLPRDYPAYLLDVNGELTPRCEDPFLQTIESDLLLKLYEWEHLRCHRIIEPYVACPVDSRDSKFGVEASSPGADEVTGIKSAAVSTARHFDRVIAGEDDLALIKDPVVTHDEKNTARRLEILNAVFAGVIDVKLRGTDYFQFVPWDDLLSWMGIEEGMYDFVLNPEFMHSAMRRYTEASMRRAKRYEELGILTSNNQALTVGSGGYGLTSRLPAPTASGIGAKLRDMWGYAADQIMTSVSPEMSREFAFDHERHYADLFGMNYYGCCERLDHKLDDVRTLPRLRKVSLSPYANIEEGMEKLAGGDVVVSFKPNSNYLAVNPPEFSLLRKELVQVCELARKHNCHVEIIMKTIITLCGDPQRLWKWCDLAMEVINNY